MTALLGTQHNISRMSHIKFESRLKMLTNSSGNTFGTRDFVCGYWDAESACGGDNTHPNRPWSLRLFRSHQWESNTGRNTCHTNLYLLEAGALSSWSLLPLLGLWVSWLALEHWSKVTFQFDTCCGEVKEWLVLGQYYRDYLTTISQWNGIETGWSNHWQACSE